jgi:hypothetical protein
MATDVQIANLALSRIGHESALSSFSASGNKASRWFYVNYEIIKLAMLREFGWRFAIKRAILEAEDTFTITDASETNPVVITTSAAHGLSNADVVYIAGVIGMSEINGRTFTVANKTATTFELSGEDGTGHSLYSSSGTVYKYIATEFGYRYDLPSDCLRIVRINGGEKDKYRIEAGWLYTNYSSPNGTIDIEYIFDETTDASFDAQFTDVFAQRLAAEICFYMTDNSGLSEQQWKLYQDKVRLAWTMDSRQGTPRGIDADAWLDARV